MNERRVAGSADGQQITVAPRPAELKLRRFLLLTAGFIWLGSIVELLLSEHTGEWIQYVPFVVCVIGAASIAGVIVWNSVVSRRFLYVASSIAIVTSLVGAWQHYSANLELELEVHATASKMTSMWEALFGASPLLAPGILALAGILAMAAVWEPANRNK